MIGRESNKSLLITRASNFHFHLLLLLTTHCHLACGL